MLMKIDYTHPIFKNEAYQRNIVSFNLIEAIKFTAKLIMSDERSCIICSMLSSMVPAWIWTTEDISESELNNMSVCFYEKFVIDNKAYYVAKPDVATYLVEKYNRRLRTSIYRIQMQSFECPVLIPAVNNSVIIENAVSEDLEEIALYCRNFAIDCFKREISYEDSIKEAKDFINRLKSFVIRQNGKAVAMAKSARETEKHIAINGVYTLPQYRGRGYAAALVAHICKLIIAEGKTPVLYTDISNPSSNKAYTNVGFIQCGRVDEVKLNLLSQNTSE